MQTHGRENTAERQETAPGGTTGQLPSSESSFRPGKQHSSGRQASGAAQRDLFPLPPGGPLNTGRQLSLTARSTLLAFSSTRENHRTRFHFLPLPGPTPLTGLLSGQESTHTCPHVGRCTFEPRAYESLARESRGAVLARTLTGMP